MATQEKSESLATVQPRREFLKTAGAGIFGLTVIPRYALGGAGYTAPSGLLNVAMIGTGGQGMQNLRNLLEESDVRIAAIADVAEEADYSAFYHKVPGGRKPGFERISEKYAGDSSRKGYPACKVYTDFRKMLEAEKGIDAVVVSTPDHNHTIAAMAAMLAGKHVYVEKPLARTIREARVLTETAARTGVVTQMGHQGHGDEGIRLTREWIRDGAIGAVSEVHAWSSGVNRASFTGLPTGDFPVPAGLDWNLWHGPAEIRPYHPEYTPCGWRHFWDFGTGKLGDMGCHNMDPAFYALDLGYPEWVQARCAWGPERLKRPLAATVHYRFPSAGDRPAVKMNWYEGLMPPRPDELEPGRDLTGDGNGILFIGDKGKLMCPGWAGNPRLIPESRMKEYRLPPKTIPRVGGIYRDWINACKSGAKASSDFSYSGPLAEVILMGVIAMRTEEKIYWDGPAMKAVNFPDVDRYVTPEYKNGWKLG
jgi:predicted dehydrogenase